MIFRDIKADDQMAFEKLQRQLDTETIYMAFEKEDRDLWAKHLDSTIDWFLTQKNSKIIIAQENDDLVGFLQITQHSLKRTNHIGTLFVGVLQKATGKGVGTKLFETLETWLKTTDLKRIELTVVVENVNAVHLYKKFGFEIEGTKKKSFLIEGKFYDEYYMSKFF